MSQATESEERLLIEAAQKDPSRFAELYEQNFHRVYAYIARRVRDRAEVQDLTAHVDFTDVDYFALVGPTGSVVL